MKKPELKMTMMQLTPALPDPYELTRDIAASIRFIDENPDCDPQDIPENMLDLLSVSDDLVQTMNARFEEFKESSESPKIVCSFIVFAHLYMRRYSTEDFADFGNFIDTYSRFQNLLKALRRRKSASGIPCNIHKIFDLDNLDETIDAINASGHCSNSDPTHL